jgi:hypothetical protein
MRILEIFKMILNIINPLFLFNFFLIYLCKILTKYRFFYFQIIILNIYIIFFKGRDSKLIMLLANSYSQQREVKNEYNTLKKFYLLNIIKTNEDIARLGYLSVIQNDFEFTKKLLIDNKSEKILFFFLSAIFNSRKPPFIDYHSFLKVVDCYKKKKITIENYIKLSSNIIGYNKKTIAKKRKVYLRNFIFNKKNKKKGCFILISCDLNFFDIFSEHYVSNFRKLNDQIVHFHIVSNNSKKEIINKFNKLNNYYKNLGLSIEKEQKKNKVYITMSRFLVSRKLMQYYKSDVFINDIDLTPCYDMNLIIKKITTKKYNVGFYDEYQKIPWTRFAAGVCFLKYKDKQSLKFLKKLTNFYDYKIKYHEQLFWSADQFGLALIQNIMNKELKIFNFYDYKNILDFNKIVYVPRTLALKKIKSKFNNKKLDE